MQHMLHKGLPLAIQPIDRQCERVQDVVTDRLVGCCK